MGRFATISRRLILVLCSCTAVDGGAMEVNDIPIGWFDLRYTANIDVRKPEQVRMAWDHCHTLATLQGIVNRNGPRLYLQFVQLGSRDIDQYWFDKYRQAGRWLAGRPVVTYPDIVAVVRAYRSFIQGAVVYDPAVPATSNAASTVAGVQDLLAIRYDPSAGSLYHRLVVTGPRLPVRVWLLNEDGTSKFTGSGMVAGTQKKSTRSAKCDVYLWLQERYLDTNRCDGRYGAYYLDSFWTTKPGPTVINHHTLTNHDFFVSKRAFFFDLSPWADERPNDDPAQPLGTDRRMLESLLGSAYQQTEGKEIIHIGGFPPWPHKYTSHAGSGKHDGVPTEWEYARLISAYNAFQDADAYCYGALANASFWMHFPLQGQYPQKWVTREELRERGYLTPEGAVRFDDRHFILFYVGDYDAASWLYQRIPDIWDHPDRGKVPLMWAVSPVLDRRVPMAMDYLRETATANDYFVAADNGAGYLNPGMLQEPRPLSGLPSGVDAWAAHCAKYYRRWGLTVTGFIIDGYAPGLNSRGLDAYARFSPHGIVPQKIPLSLLHKQMPVIRAGWDVNQTDPAEAARVILGQIESRPLPFHWFRNILKSPGWYVRLQQQLRVADPKIELLDAPTFFELARIYLENHPQAARGEW